jgi:hypothetical protein
MLTRWPCRNWTSRGYSGGALGGCRSTHCARFASGARSQHDTRRSSSGERPGARTSGPEWSSLPIARLRYSAANQAWTLYWRDRNLRFHADDLLAPSHRVEDLLAEIDRDPTGIFWG